MSEPALKKNAPFPNWEDVLVILLLAALFYLPGLGQVPLFDRDEPRFSSATISMLDTGNYTVPMFNGGLRPDKPPLLYWLMSVTYRLAGVNELGARLPSAVCSSLTLLVVYVAAGKRFGRVTGILSAFILGSCVLFIVESRLATADATMILFNTIAMACAWQAWDAAPVGAGEMRTVLPRAESLQSPPSLEYVSSAGARRRLMPIGYAVGFWLALAAGVLAKGVPLLFTLLPMLILSLLTGQLAEQFRSWKKQSGDNKIAHFPNYVASSIIRGNWGWLGQLRPWLALPLFVLPILGWGVKAWYATEVHGELIMRMLGHHVIDRARMAAEGHSGFVGYYVLMVWATFFPWSILLVPMGFHMVRRLRGRSPIAIDPRPYQFLAVWIIPSWIVFELVKTKLVHYVLPLYIPLAILAADTLVQSTHRLTDVLAARWFSAARWFYLGVWVVLAGVALAFPYYFISNREVVWLALPLAGAFLATGVTSTLLWNRPAWPFMVVLGFCASLLVANNAVIPQIGELRISKNILADAAPLEARGYAIEAVGYQEPSLVFYNHGAMTFPDQLPPPSDEGFWSPTSARPTLLIVDRAGLEQLEAWHVHFTMLSQYTGMQTDALISLRGWFNSFRGKGAKPAQSFQASLITNVDPYPAATTAATSQTMPGAWGAGK